MNVTLSAALHPVLLVVYDMANIRPDYALAQFEDRVSECGRTARRPKKLPVINENDETKPLSSFAAISTA